MTLVLLRFLPRNLLSFLFGRFAALRLPPALLLPLLRWYSRRYGVNLQEAARPLESYTSLLDFFTRDLRANSRSVGDGVVSPVDGKISEFGPLTGERLIQAKGMDYTLGELLASQEVAQKYAGGFFLTIYLAPGDYHHIHSPVDGEISGFTAIPGTLWPVNETSVLKIPNLFCINERLISFIQSRDFGTVAVVKVGATNVGSIALAYDPFVTNSDPLARSLFGSFESTRVVRREFQERKPIARGERLGTFRLGSTVILLFEPGRFQPTSGCGKGMVTMGKQIGD